MTGLNPLAWSDVAFIILYIVLFLAALGAGSAIAATFRPEGRCLPVTDEEELAVLAGGSTRLAETVLARMLASGKAVVYGGKVHFRAAEAGGSEIERRMAALDSPGEWKEIGREAAQLAGPIEDRLAARGLLVEPGEARQLAVYASLPLMVLGAFGTLKFVSDPSVGFLVVVVFTAVTALIQAKRMGRVTGGGAAALADARERSARLMLAPTKGETGMAVALFGTSVLAGSPIAELHDVNHKARKNDGGCGGGGCGGGCGGCGG